MTEEDKPRIIQVPLPPEKTKQQIKEEDKKKKIELKKAKEEEKRRVRTEQDRRRVILKKYKGIIKKYYETTQFKEPLGILLRRTGRAEFHEDLSTSTFTFKHSDGEERTILLDSRQIHIFDYGDKTFRGYILHEDHPIPLPTDPLITLEEMGTTIDKVLTDIKDWKIKELKSKGDLIWKILIGIALIILAYAMYKMLAPQDQSGQAEQTAVQAIQTASANISGSEVVIIK